MIFICKERIGVSCYERLGSVVPIIYVPLSEVVEYRIWQIPQNE